MKEYIKLLRGIIAIILYRKMSDSDKRLVKKDIEMFLKWDEWNMLHSNVYLKLSYCLINYRSFRNVFYYRAHKFFVLRKLSSLILPSISSIEIGGNIGGGLYIPHNIAIIYPKEAGENLNIKPGVVIGQAKGKYPVIGDNVFIGANAVVIGDIRIGNNVNIGAGTVVMHDIPDNTTIVSSSERIIYN